VPRPYPAEFGARAVALVRAGRPISRVAVELGISEGGLHKWVRQDRVDHNELPGVTTSECADLRAARKRIRELELQAGILTRASAFLAGERSHPKGAPGDRQARRRRAAGQGVLPGPGGQQPGLLQVPGPPGVGDPRCAASG